MSGVVRRASPAPVIGPTLPAEKESNQVTVLKKSEEKTAKETAKVPMPEEKTAKKLS